VKEAFLHITAAIGRAKHVRFATSCLATIASTCAGYCKTNAASGATSIRPAPSSRQARHLSALTTAEGSTAMVVTTTTSQATASGAVVGTARVAQVAIYVAIYAEATMVSGSTTARVMVATGSTARVASASTTITTVAGW
jgi:hypothetical protein